LDVTGDEFEDSSDKSEEREKNAKKVVQVKK
jgi:hypothetical protein